MLLIKNVSFINHSSVKLTHKAFTYITKAYGYTHIVKKTCSITGITSRIYHGNYRNDGVTSYYNVHAMVIRCKLSEMKG